MAVADDDDYAPRDYTREDLKDAFDGGGGAKLGANPHKQTRPPPPDATTGLKPVMVVFFVGGVTYAEIAALRFLSKRDDFPSDPGESQDWMYGAMGIRAAILLELRGGSGFCAPAASIIPVGEEALAGVVAMAEFVADEDAHKHATAIRTRQIGGGSDGHGHDIVSSNSSTTPSRVF